MTMPEANSIDEACRRIAMAKEQLENPRLEQDHPFWVRVYQHNLTYYREHVRGFYDMPGYVERALWIGEFYERHPEVLERLVINGK